MNAYARTSTSATDAENIFYRMKTVAMQFDFPDLWPDNVSCTTLMRAWIHEAKPGFVTKVLGLLREMEESPNVKLHPDLVTYAVVLDALAQSGEELAGEKGEAILDQMVHRGLMPNRVCYNSVMTTYARQGDVDNAKKILEIMENEYAAGNLSSKPIARDYSSYIAALSELDSPSEENFQQSLELFMFIADRYKQGDKQFQVGGPILTSLMTLLAKTYTNDKIAIAKHVFKLAKEMNIPIDAVVYNTFLWVCSSISGSNDEKLEALELAVKSFQTMKNEGIQSDSHTFIYLMLCSRNLISDKDEQAAAIEEFFQRCCQEGLVNEAVLSHFQNFVPGSHLLLELRHKNAGDMGHVPSQ
jgi:pentatricopeptide repeat protein